jgi:hypothetical protein
LFWNCHADHFRESNSQSDNATLADGFICRFSLNLPHFAASRPEKCLHAKSGKKGQNFCRQLLHFAALIKSLTM